jgi:hypothetical protein
MGSTPWPEASSNTDLCRLVAAAADLCRKPLRHGVLLVSAVGDEDCTLMLEARSAEGERLRDQDLELDIFRSGADLHLTLAWREDDRRPTLWQGSHHLWMTAEGERCPCPGDGTPLEALARRLRSLLAP